ncbi:MAG TPA: TonB-dependent receptor [Flavobacteriaceae bacterium]|nr:TonB-dependent receptor [Flavobacteriaceae bacterium]MCB9213973.1 TonB-dependent receptor [Alteromonas sp.]HPF11868.1 TonB-dependent receptor [Flavobacteriaceae bacterium]HQU21145.1 TonB-dependent receptor [Flavobacteriaceae bacterium]HQU65345.1 TonB-dependent receptor [Flavobacteriaceae bacterium]
MKKSFFLICSCLAVFNVWAQEDDDLGTEVVNVVKPYTPTISDAFKVKETPVLNDSTTSQKKEVRYEIFSVPVASTFTPSKGKAATVDKAKPIRLYDNYATLGFGNYTSILGELFSNFEISRTDQAGFFFRHNSSQGDIPDVLLENKYYDTELTGNYTSRQKEMTARLEAGISHQLFNWYGLDAIFETALPETIASIDPQQTYFGGHLGGSLKLEDSFFKDITASIHYLRDAYGSSEFQGQLRPKFQFPIADFTFQLQGNLDFLSGSFDRNYFSEEALQYGYLNTGIAPSLIYANEDLTLALGTEVVFSLNTQQSSSDLFVYPQINASYRLVNEILIVYGGAEGGLKQNTYRGLKDENPFVSPTLFLMPTSQLYNGFGGIKGKLSNEVSYNLRGSYGKEQNKAFFQLNPYKGMNPDLEGYEYGNSFGIVYDDVNTLGFFGELKVEISESFSLGAHANYYSYTLDQQPEAWNLPNIEASVFSNFEISEAWYGGVSLFFVGERKELSDVVLVTTETLDSYFDVNANLGYRVNDRLSIFAKGSNLLGNNYEKWFNYPVQGIQGLLGATYKFDW